MSVEWGGSDQPFIDYTLPEELIAQHPVEPRDSSRLLVINRESGRLDDRLFSDLPEFLQPGDLLVLNDTKVLPARIAARRSTGGKVEILLLERRDGSNWSALVNPLGRLRAGERLTVGDSEAAQEITFVGREADIGIVRIEDDSILERFGKVPLPPYIRTSLGDAGRYQTVYARKAGSSAAPTAGLHFTTGTLDRALNRGIGIARLTLHVGVDTFRPLSGDSIEDHTMHSEWYEVPGEVAEAIRKCQENGGRVVAVGTTVTRVLETVGSRGRAELKPGRGRTSLFIRPPYEFQVVDALVTNFHLPRTSLLLLVGAFTGSELLRHAYEHAIASRYRFYSFGDAMLIV